MKPNAELLIVGIGCAIVAVIVAFSYRENEACKAAGGVMMRERMGVYECVKVERAK